MIIESHTFSPQIVYFRLTRIENTFFICGPDWAICRSIGAFVGASVARVGAMLGHPVGVLHTIAGVFPGGASFVFVHAIRIAANFARFSFKHEMGYYNTHVTSSYLTLPLISILSIGALMQYHLLFLVLSVYPTPCLFTSVFLSF